MRQILILWHILFLVFVGAPLWLSAQNCGRTDTTLIGANKTFDIDVEITDVINNDLAAPNQGICGIELGFVHQLSENLEIWLTSPAGQRIQLIGPNTPDNAAFTFLASWNITFVKCSATAQPDSGYVAKWNNGQPNNFISGGRYHGSYYPYVGCLEDFNTGSINGTWKISIRNNPSVPYAGAITYFRLILCDPRGFLCCDANPGSLAAYPDVQACEGSAALQLNLKPDYGATPPPDTSEYGYTYMISQDGILLKYDSLADLRDMPVGNYEVCGLSYRKSDFSSFPQPDGVLLTDVFRRQLNGDSLLICGKMNNNCVGVRITGADTTMVQRDICQGQSVQIGNQTFTTAGDYFVTLPGSGGCDSIINLKLNVVPGFVTTLDTTICSGDSIRIGNSIYKTSGTYSDTLQMAGGCDSIVNLNLTVRTIPPTFLTAVICQGETYSAGGQTFDSSGQYDFTIPAASGCDSLISLTLLVLSPSAQIAPPDTINCQHPSVRLDGSASGPPGEVDFLWTSLRGDTLGVDSTLTVDSVGFYVLTVTQTIADFSCAARDTVQVFGAADMPLADVAPGYEINCTNPTVTIGGSNTSTGPNISYRWHIVNGNILGDSTQQTATVDASGRYILIVTNTSSGCSDTASTVVTANFTPPIARIDAVDTLSCEQTAVTLDIGNSSRGATIQYTWRDSVGTVLGTGNQQDISSPGKYFLEVMNTQNGCSARDSIRIASGIGMATVTFGDTLIPCNVDTFTLQAFISPPNGNYAFFWNGDGVIGGSDSLSTLINKPGEYILTVANLDNDCIINHFVEVAKDTNCAQICVQISPPDTLTCLRDSIQIIASFCETCTNCSLQWTTSDGNILSGADQLLPIVNAPGTYTLTVNSPDGSTQSFDIQVIQELNPPIADAGSDQMLSCTDTVATLNGNNSSVGANITYRWTTSGGNIVSGADGLNPIVDAPGIYILTVSQNTCTAVDSVEVSSDESVPPMPSFGDEFLTCLNPTVTLDGRSFINGNLVGRWCEIDSTGMTINCLDNGLLIVNTAGTYRFEIRDTTTGCRNSTMVRVINNAIPPSVNAGATDTLNCVQASLTLQPSITPANGDYRYRWTTVNGSSVSNDTILNPIVTQADIYILEVTNATSGCVARDSVEILQNAEAPSAFAGFDTLLTCAVTSLQLDGRTLGSNLIYNWSTSGGNIVSGANTLNPVVNQPGTYFFRVTNSLSNCTAEDTLVVTQNITEPTAAVQNADQLNLACNVTALTLDGCASLSGTGAALRFQWQALNGATILNPDSCSIAASRKGDYQLLVEDISNGCRDSLTVTVNQNPDLPNVTIAPPQTITCLRDSVTLTAQVANGFATAWISPSGQVLSTTNLNISVTKSGTYTFVVANNVTGCSDSTSVNVKTDTIKPIVNIDPPSSLDCQVQMVDLVANASGGTRLSYNWTTTDGSILSGADTRIATVNAGGNYTVLVTNLDNGCTNQAVSGVKQGESSINQAFFTVTPANCIRQGSGFVQIDSVSGGIGPYLYALGELSFAPDDFFQNIRAGEYTLRVQDINGCEWETQVVVPAPEPITVELGSDTLINFGDTIALEAILDSSRLQNIVWLVNGDTASYTGTQIIVSPPLSSQYRVTVTASNGCTASDIVNVAVTQVISAYAPNAFSPNGDGINDVFMIYAGKNVKQVKAFMIFDRWGNRLLFDGPFQPNDPKHGWDGTFKGKLMDAGVYVFYAEVEIVDGHTEIVEGDITLLR